MKTQIITAFEILGISPTEAQLRLFEQYSQILLDGNSRVNLTRITDPGEIAQKHFADSLLPLKHILPGSKCIDVGSGAGFPGLPLLFMQPIYLTLLDSLNKRIEFLRQALVSLGVEAQCLHARAEDAARTELRESFDFVFSRAVAPAAVLMEYTLPFCKTGGMCVAYKGADGAREIREAQRAIELLGGELAGVEEYDLPWGKRTIALIAKTRPTQKIYPRKAGTPEKSPL